MSARTGVPQRRVMWREVAAAAYAGGHALPAGDTPGLEAALSAKTPLVIGVLLGLSFLLLVVALALGAAVSLAASFGLRCGPAWRRLRRPVPARR